MKSEQVDRALCQKFIAEQQRLVFWHDPNGEFAEYVAGGLTGDLAPVKILDVASTGGLAAKLLLEREDTTGQYLVYSQGELPPPEEDWLLDVRLYSAEFEADVASLWLQELGLSSLSLREYLKTRRVFLGSQDRRKKLRGLTTACDDQASLDLKMMAVLVGSPLAAPFDVLRTVCQSHCQGQGLGAVFDLQQIPEVIAVLERMALLDRFWELMGAEFAYISDSPSVAGLLRRILATELFSQTDGAKLESLAHLQLPPAGRRNVVVFLTQWRDSSVAAGSYEAAAASVAAEQNVGAALSLLGLETLKRVFTFWEAEKRVVSSLKERLLAETQAVNVESIIAVANARKAGYWLVGPGSGTVERHAIVAAYDAIVAAAQLFALQVEHRNALTFETAEALLSGYQKVLYRFDRLYRRFCSEAKPAAALGWDLLKTLAMEVERVYDQGFLQPFAVGWGHLLDNGFLETWKPAGLITQRQFYPKVICPHLAEGDRKRAFVIISDAFRYEAATELTEVLNGKYRMDAQLSAMLGVLPSCTSLGMASLLPHSMLASTDKGDILVDGKNSAGTEARDRQLATVQGMACLSGHLLGKTQEEAREFTRGKRVVYIYHNVIDARGDSASTESETFEAVADCIGELVALVQFCINKLNAAKVWVTADHGFLFQQGALDDTDKTKLSHVPLGTVKDTKRYIVGHNLGPTAEAHHGSLAVTGAVEGGMEFWVPRGTKRFHFAGGARYVHGGAMPQEVVIPVVAVTQLTGKQKEASRAEKVSVQLLGSRHKITTPKYRFEFIQTEAVSERRLPITVRAAVYDDDQPVTSIEIVTFDSTSNSIEERKKAIRLDLRTGTFDKQKTYRLVLRDAENDAEIQSVPVVIDRSFDDDF